MDSFNKTFPYNERELENFESNVDNVMKILQSMCSDDKEMQENGIAKADKFLETTASDHLQDVNEENFIVKIREDRTVINKVEKEGKCDSPQEMDRFTFMQQIEEDANKRAENRKKREEIAYNLKKLGNEAFRNGEYERAISMYSKAIDHVKDSPVLYNNRSLSYIRLQLFKRAIIDSDFIINKLDEKNLRAWLYRATSYFYLDDIKNFEKSIKTAKKNNSKELEYIEKFVEDLKSGKFDVMKIEIALTE